MTTSEGQRRLGSGRRQPLLEPGTTDPYAILGLYRTVSQADIKAAYFTLVREHPPERDPETFKLIRSAYDRLRTAGVRAETELFLLQQPPPWQPRRRHPRPDLSLHAEDVLAAARAWSDLERRDFAEDLREVKL